MTRICNRIALRVEKGTALLITGGLLVLYVLSYVVLSLLGGYVFWQSGELRYKHGLSVSDIIHWEPSGCVYQHGFRDIHGETVSRGNILGYIYSPLIRLDRWLVHPTRQWCPLIDDTIASTKRSSTFRRSSESVSCQQ